MFNTLGVFSASVDIPGDIIGTSWRYLEHIGECSVHRRDIMIYVGGNYEYIARVLLHQGIS